VNACTSRTVIRGKKYLTTLKKNKISEKTFAFLPFLFLKKLSPHTRKYKTFLIVAEHGNVLWIFAHGHQLLFEFLKKITYWTLHYNFAREFEIERVSYRNFFFLLSIVHAIYARCNKIFNDLRFVRSFPLLLSFKLSYCIVISYHAHHMIKCFFIISFCGNSFIGIDTF